jgi:hypothetical protein
MDAMGNATKNENCVPGFENSSWPQLGNASGSDVATGATKSRRRWGDGNPLNNVNTCAGLGLSFQSQN